MPKHFLSSLLLLTPMIFGSAAISTLTDNPKPLVEGVSEVVTMTTYHAKAGQTDSTPFVTASGYKINAKHPERDRIIAISRDLKKNFKFGDSVLVTNAGKGYDGVYYIHDVMNKRFRKKIDILISSKARGTKPRNVIIKKL